MWESSNVEQKSSFNNNVLTVVTKHFREEKYVTLLNISVDGVSCDTDFVSGKLCKFLEVKSIHVGIIDPNHSFNISRYKIIGSYECAIIGKCIIEPYFLRPAGVNKLLWRINEYVSNFLLPHTLKFQSFVEQCKIKIPLQFVALCLTIYLMRLLLFSTNIKQCDLFQPKMSPTLSLSGMY